MWALALLRSARLLLLPICGTMLGLDPSQVGLIKSWSAAADALLFYPVGLAMDRLGRKWTAVPCLLLLSIGVWIAAWADSYSWLVIGGVTNSEAEDNVRKVPLFGDIPILGWMFKQTGDRSTSTELVVFITPSIVRREATTASIPATPR